MFTEITIKLLLRAPTFFKFPQSIRIFLIV
ncbi:CLUMA_CG016353, isoform A, partial [Clunio marinus]